MPHNMMDPVAIVSYPASDRATSPAISSSLSQGLAIVFSSMEELDAALTEAGDSAAFINSLTLNDKIYRMRYHVDQDNFSAFGSLGDAVTDTVDPTTEVMEYGTVWVNTSTPEVFQTLGDGNWTSVWSSV